MSAAARRGGLRRPVSLFRVRATTAVDDGLQAVVARGTGAAAARTDRIVAGKTGTTSNFRDAWFVGYSRGPCCVVAVWVGFPDDQRAMTDVAGKGPVTGSGLPARIFARVLDAAIGLTPTS